MRKKLPPVSRHKRPISLFCETYRINIYFMPGFSQKEIDYAFKQNDWGEPLQISDGSGRTSIYRGRIFIWTKERKRNDDLLATLAHETFHASSFILDDRGVLPSFENDEPQAYLHDWIFRQFLRYIK